jgi:hypothetical protein
MLKINIVTICGHACCAQTYHQQTNSYRGRVRKRYFSLLPPPSPSFRPTPDTMAICFGTSVACEPVFESTNPPSPSSSLPLLPCYPSPFLLPLPPPSLSSPLTAPCLPSSPSLSLLPPSSTPLPFKTLLPHTPPLRHHGICSRTSVACEPVIERTNPPSTSSYLALIPCSPSLHRHPFHSKLSFLALLPSDTMAICSRTSVACEPVIERAIPGHQGRRRGSH